jgi:TonB family protein
MKRANHACGAWSNALRLLTLSLMAAVCVSGQEGRKLTEQPVPIYPQLARRSGLSGTVKVQIVIAPDGHVKDVKVVGGHPLFVDATVEALKKWKYAPSNSETTAALEFNFHP